MNDIKENKSNRTVFQIFCCDTHKIEKEFRSYSCKLASFSLKQRKQRKKA